MEKVTNFGGDGEKGGRRTSVYEVSAKGDVSTSRGKVLPEITYYNTEECSSARERMLLRLGRSKKRGETLRCGTEAIGGGSKGTGPSTTKESRCCSEKLEESEEGSILRV